MIEIRHRFLAAERTNKLAGMELALDATDEEILGAVEVWIDDLARGDYAAAFARTRHDPYYQWTPHGIESVIHGYGLPEPHPSGVRFVVTARDQAHTRGRPFHRVVDRDVVRESAVAEVWYDLPLNGQWSDLTATFRLERDGARLHLVLQQIHVF